MNLHAFYRNFVHKIPKILLLILILYALSLGKGMIFGHSGNSEQATDYTELKPEVVNTFFGRDVILTTQDSILYEVRNEAEATEPTGYVIVGDRTTNNTRGFGGKVPVAVFLDDGMIVRGIRLLDNSESRRFVERLREGRFLDRWNGRHLYDPIPQMDAFSGATYTSRAVITNVNQTLAALLDRKAAPLSWNTFVNNYLGEFAILFVVIMSLACFISPDPTRRLRIPLLLLSVVVLGIWQGAFVSLDLLYKWLIYGTSPLVRFGIFTVVVTAVILPLLTNKSFYCAYLCPFGASQELLGKLVPYKYAIPKRILKISKWARRAMLAVIVVLLLVLVRFELADIEPFTAFLIRSASASALILAGISLLASLFFQRPWCRLLCPTGEILSILRRPLKYPRRLFLRSRKR